MPVYSSDGTHIGSLHRLIVDREGWDVHAVIVRETPRFSGHFLTAVTGVLPTAELVVPAAAVRTVADDRVDLSITSTQARRLPPYLSYHYSAPGSSAQVLLAASAALSGIAPTWFGTGAAEEANKAEDEIEIRPGEPVMLGHDGKRLGEVREVVYDDGELVGIVVQTGGLLGHDNVVVQVRFLDRSDDGALFVRMSREDLEHLLADRSTDAQGL